VFQTIDDGGTALCRPEPKSSLVVPTMINTLNFPFIFAGITY